MLENVGQGNLIGPIHAESFAKDDKVIKSYITSNGDNDILNDKFISSIIGGDKLILSGIRGCGKTMILRTTDVLLKRDIKTKLLDKYEYELSEEHNKVLPLYLSYSGFKNDVSLQNELELNEEEIKYVREIFRGYFFMSILQKLLKRIEELELDNNIEFNLFGLRTRFGIKREVDKAIDTFKRLGFRELVKSKKAGLDLQVKIKEICLPGASAHSATETKEITMDDMQKTELFKGTIASICKVYKIDKIMLLFDEVFYLKFLQKEFFDILFGFRNYSKLTFAISAYPNYMDYGDQFDIPDDAKEISVTSAIYKPNKKSYERPLIELVRYRLKEYGKKELNDIITNEALEFLILLTNGNPRILLQSIDNIWRKNNNNKITISNITQDIIFEMVDNYYISFMKDQFKRYKTNNEKANQFIKIVSGRIREYNRRNGVATIFFLINDEILNHFSDTINMLHYSRIIDKVRISSFGSSVGQKGRMFMLNPMAGWYHGIFTKEQISDLPEQIKLSNDKDKKIQFNSLKIFLSNIQDTHNISCPALEKDLCPEIRCKDSYNETWTLCPFHRGIVLEIDLPVPEQVSINVLNLTTGILRRLKEAGIETLKDVITRGVNGLQEIYQIGTIRSNNIYYSTKEYIDDNL